MAPRKALATAGTALTLWLCASLQVVAAQSSSTAETTDVCLRWAQASTIQGGLLYLFGGQAKTYSTQTQGTWNNNLIAINVSTGWSIASPPLQALSSSGSSAPPAVALGALYGSQDGRSLYQMMGETSDAPNAAPAPFAVHQYDIAGNSWSQLGADTSGILGVGEGGYTFDPTKGVAYYFGGHQDSYTTNGWSDSIGRIYLDSLLQFDTTKNYFYNASTYTPNAGATNISSYEDTPVLRADNTLTYVPGIGQGGGDGIVSLGGGSASANVGFNIIDVFDIPEQAWRRVPTSGDIPPPVRVNHCAALAQGTDPKNNNANSSTIVIYGGQNVRNETTQLSDVYALDVGSWTWTFVGKDLQSQPGGLGTGRSGHSCNVVGGHMVVVGGYPGADILCDQPGTYVFDVSQLAWVNDFDPTSKYVVNDRLQRPTASSTASASASASTSISVMTIVSGTSTILSTSTITNAAATDGLNSSGGSSSAAAGGSSSNVGAIIGGVIGGLAVLLLLLLLLLCLRRRRRDGSGTSEKSGGVNRWLGDRYGFARTSNETEGGRASLQGSTANGSPAIGSKHSPSASLGSRPATAGHQANVTSPLMHSQSASDDPEEMTRGMEAVSVGRFMKPKGELKILNPDREESIAGVGSGR